MKKAIIILIIVLLLVTVVGCRGNTQTSYQAQQPQYAIGQGCSVSEPEHSSPDYIDRTNMRL